MITITCHERPYDNKALFNIKSYDFLENEGIKFHDYVGTCVKISAMGESAKIVGFLLNRPVGDFVRVFGDDAKYCISNWKFGYENFNN